MSDFFPPVLPPNPMFSEPFFSNQPQIFQMDKMEKYYFDLQKAINFSATSQIPLNLQANIEAARDWNGS